MQKGSEAHDTHHPPQTSLYEALGQPLRHIGGTLAQTLVNLSDSGLPLAFLGGTLGKTLVNLRWYLGPNLGKPT